jgi:sugar phosphate isomerase/epimerase
MRLSSGRHLGYCTNVHAYADLAGLVAALETGAAPLRTALVAAGRLDADAPLGVGLWLPATAARQVADDPAPLRERLRRLRLYAFTVNAFPWGDFHGARVKDAVFRPSWAERERLDYTLAAARALAALLPDGVDGSLSTHSGGYKPWHAADAGARARHTAAATTNLLTAADGLARLQADTGRRVVLALEPEPLSTLETTAEVVEAFATRLAASDHARAHLGLCFDACHQAVEFEDMAASLDALAAAGVPVAKLQLSSAIRVPDPAGAADLLSAFAEDRWFHQTAVRQGRAVRMLPDLPAALADPLSAAADEWRIHFHVPLFAGSLDGQGRLATTRPDLESLLALLARESGPAVTDHLEIETYSFGMIPRARRAELGAVELGDCLRREYEWVLDHLEPDRLEAAAPGS